MPIATGTELSRLAYGVEALSGLDIRGLVGAMGSTWCTLGSGATSVVYLGWFSSGWG
ncbi:predicted protein [Plenodomus lingam JN3]|uniref:Predicted protein n=1 Tax=Leptosphaeria maculans (strain JN3 / isolate v23.1.3 / race Av1-4-5-6-7-8) TaxID=985895 RepID=E4ZX57_LEPMJ|nr:predicted protein [Plenodomus lingam JN3]CBX95267.1 predicted protein [Plenodomus lingam JN3]